MGDEVVLKRENYLLLKNLRVEIEEKAETFSLCFWLYLVNSTPITILQKVRQNVTSSSPFLVIHEKKVILFPLLPLPREDSDPEVSHACVEVEFSREKWVHLRCEVSTDFLRLHIDGEIVGEKPLSSVLETDSIVNGFGKITLVSGAGDDSKNRGHIYNLKILPTTSSIKDHHAKDPPVQLSIDKSSAFEIEEGDGGVWSIVGGKASCHRNFSLDVVFTDTSGHPVREEMEVVASLAYLDDEAPVERTSDGEAPLLASHDGLELASYEWLSKLLNGRTSFKLKISQLSSKCQNRLFRIKFYLPKMETYPFFEAFSPPIHCISWNWNT